VGAEIRWRHDWLAALGARLRCLAAPGTKDNHGDCSAHDRKKGDNAEQFPVADSKHGPILATPVPVPLVIKGLSAAALLCASAKFSFSFD
jgi:hypothetical protein